MKKPLPADLQRWSEELASDPGSLVFLPLARAYRRQNRADAALRLCLRGLEHHPDNADAHGLLALLYVDRGDHRRAADEWSFVLRLDPSNFDALRGLGFCHLENGELAQARDRLERASLIRPDDAAVREALRFIADRSDEDDADPSQYAAPDDVVGGAPEPAVLPEPEVWSTPPARSVPAAVPAAYADPARLFDALVTGPVLGALLLDTRGMVLAGELPTAGAGAEALAAVLGSVSGEATRTVALLGLGSWQGVLLEAVSALLHIAPAGPDAVILLVARAGTPAGWIGRSAAHAAALAQQFLEAYA